MDKTRLSQDERIQKLNELNKDITVLKIERKENGHRKLLLRCNKCGHEWEKSIAGFTKNPTCPNCNCGKPKNKPRPSKRYTNEEWIAYAKQVHPEYDYSKTQYIRNTKPVIVICPKHGEFSITPKGFLKPQYRCAKCKKEERLAKLEKQFIEESKKIHPEYDYSKTHFTGIKNDVIITCPKHGDFKQTARNHLIKGCRCPKCVHETNADKKRFTTEQFITKARQIHGLKYDYSKVDYKGYGERVCIICPEHGEFWQIAAGHLNGQGCPYCGNNHHFTQEEIIEKFRATHGDKYDYSKVDFKRTHDKVCIICHEKDEFGNEHGEFWQTPKAHLKFGCRKCSGNFLDREMFINKANVVHDNFYDYSKVEYTNNRTKVCIICPEHGEFWQIPNSHLEGRGCPLCRNSQLEKSINRALKSENLSYVYQYRNKTIFGKQSLDFYFPEKKIAVECQGEQHYISNFFKSRGIEYAENHLKYIQELDARKRQLCKENGIELIYFLERKFVKYETSGNKHFTNINDLINYIKEKP